MIHVEIINRIRKYFDLQDDKILYIELHGIQLKQNFFKKLLLLNAYIRAIQLEINKPAYIFKSKIWKIIEQIKKSEVKAENNELENKKQWNEAMKSGF